MNEKKIMQKCLDLAAKGRYLVSPNPMVGAIIVKNKKIIATGYHKKFGKQHAEVIALKKAGKRAHGSTLFVNLEPCCHFGKQPPCTREIIKAKVRKVVIATADPNPLVCGNGIKELKENNIAVKTGILQKGAMELNEKFFKFKKTGIPFVLIKNAISANGKISENNKRTSISSKESLSAVQLLRNEFDAILVGINTVIKDNPMLTCRAPKTRTPLRIIVDSKAKIPLNSRVLNDAFPTIIACTSAAKKQKLQKIAKKQKATIVTKQKNSKVDLQDLLVQLGAMNISSVLVEGGQKITGSFLKEGLADKMTLIISPKLIEKGKDFLTQKDLLKKLELKKVDFVGQDVWAKFKVH